MMRRSLGGLIVVAALLTSGIVAPALGQDTYYNYRNRQGDDSYYAQFDSVARLQDTLNRSVMIADTALIDSLAYGRAERAYRAKSYSLAEGYLIDYTTRFASAPRVADALLMLGDAQLNLGKEAEGRYNIEQAVAGECDSLVRVQANKLLAPIYEKNGDLEKAYGAYMNGVAAAETPSALYEMRRKSILLAGKLDDQAKVVDAANAMISTPGVPAGLAQFAMYQKTYAQLKLGRLDEAYAGFSELGKNNHTEAGAECRYRMVEILLMKGEHDKVQQMTIWAAQQDRGGHEYWVAKGYIAMARSLLAQGKTLDARQTLNSLIRGYANDSDGIRKEAEEGMRAITLGDKDW